MALTRQFLLDLGLEKDVMQKILDEHGETVKSTKLAAKEETEETLGKKIKLLESEKAVLEKAAKEAPKDGKNWESEHEKLKSEYDTLKSEYDTLKSEYDTLKGEYDTYKTTVESEKITESKRMSLRSHLKAEGANEKLIELLESKFDLVNVELDGDKIKDWGDLVKPVKEQFSEVFGAIEQQGAGAASPPKGQQTQEDLFIQGFDGK